MTAEGARPQLSHPSFCRSLSDAQEINSWEKMDKTVMCWWGSGQEERFRFLFGFIFYEQNLSPTGGKTYRWRVFTHGEMIVFSSLEDREVKRSLLLLSYKSKLSPDLARRHRQEFLALYWIFLFSCLAPLPNLWMTQPAFISENLLSSELNVHLWIVSKIILEIYCFSNHCSLSCLFLFF